MGGCSGSPSPARGSVLAEGVVAQLADLSRQEKAHPLVDHLGGVDAVEGRTDADGPFDDLIRLKDHSIPELAHTAPLIESARPTPWEPPRHGGHPVNHIDQGALTATAGLVSSN